MLTGRETESDMRRMRQDDMPGLYAGHTPSDHIRGGDALWWGGLR